MKRRPQPVLVRWPGYTGEITSVDDFLKCSPERQGALVQALQVLVARATSDVQRGAEIYTDAVKAAEEKFVSDREWLATIMAQYIGFSQAFAHAAASALENSSASVDTLPKGQDHLGLAGTESGAVAKPGAQTLGQ